MAGDTTTIQIDRETWRRLNAEKAAPGESFDAVIRRLLEGGGRGADRRDVDGDQEESEQGGELVEDVEELDVPGSGSTLEARREQIWKLREYLREEKSATKAEFLELVDADRVGYSSAESFWKNCVSGRDSLRALPGVASPGEGEHTWRWIGDGG